MADFPRTIVDQSVQYPYRYELRDISSGNLIATYDIRKTTSNGDVKGTDINKAYLQPIEDFLGQINADLAALGEQITAANTRITTTETTLNNKITSTQTSLDNSISTANGRMDSINTTMGTLAPLNAPTLQNPKGTTQAQTDNSTYLATTAYVTTKLNNLFAAWKA